MTRLIEKVAAVVLRGDLLLVVRKRGTSMFISPGGKPEPGETATETLARELLEETGMALRAHRPWKSYTADSALDPDATVRIQVHLADADGMARAAEEIEEVAWIDEGYRVEGIRLGSVFADHVVPELVAQGLLRQHGPRTRPRTAGSLLVADVDGTLSFEGRPPGPAVSAALAEIAECCDVRLVLATSRAPRGVRATLGPLAGRLELVCCNGAVHVVEGTVRHRRTLPAPEVRSLAGHLRAAGIGFYLEYGDRFCVHGGGFAWMAYADRIDLGGDQEPPCEDVVKVSIETPEPARRIPELRRLIGARAELWPHSGGVLDVTPAGVTKAAAIDRLADPGAYPMVAFGDDANDQVLLGRADRAVVVGDGLPGLERAGHVRRIAADDAAVAESLLHAVGRQPGGSARR